MKFEEVWSKFSKNITNDRGKKEMVPPFKKLVTELNKDCEKLLECHNNLDQFNLDLDRFNFKTQKLEEQKLKLEINHSFKTQKLKLEEKLNCLINNWKNVDIENLSATLRKNFISLAIILDQVQLKVVPAYHKKPFVSQGLDKTISVFKESFIRAKTQKLEFENLKEINTKLQAELKPIVDKISKKQSISKQLKKPWGEYFKDIRKGFSDLNQFLYKFTLEDQKLTFSRQLQLAKFNLYINNALEKIVDKDSINELTGIILIILDQLNVIEKTVPTSAVIDLKKTLTAYLTRNETFQRNTRAPFDIRFTKWKNKPVNVA